MTEPAERPTALRLVALSKRYRTGDQALSEVSLSVPAGQVLGLIGPSGAGKSTLIRCINRLVEPSAGQVFLGPSSGPPVDATGATTGPNRGVHEGTIAATTRGAAAGADRADAPGRELELTGLGRRGLRRARRRIGMIFQEYALVERLTVMENVLSGRLGYLPFWRSWLRRFPPNDVAEAFRLLDRVGLADQVNKRADALSGGQRQRVGIARALAQRPDLLLVDEPTASLDPKTSRQIMRLLRGVCAEAGTGQGTGTAPGPGLAAIVNIHDVALAKQFMMRVIGLRAGRIVYDGPPEGLTPAVLTRIYGEEDWGPTLPAEDEGLSTTGEPSTKGESQGPLRPTDQRIVEAL
ncbi:phosphonate ABC transporter ATP-binding protein [Halochromatium sp.]